MDTALAQRIIKARSDLGWSQADLAEVSGIAAAQISRYEQGRNSPRPPVIAKLAKALNVSFDWLTHGAGGINAAPEEQSKATPKGWELVELELPEDLHALLQSESESRGMTIEAIVLQAIKRSVKSDRDKAFTEINQRLSALEEQTKELASRVQAPAETSKNPTGH
ncbi:MAG: helix-turn-helix domain-containing protein [Acidovorax sp.]|jgi:transcriptional regulator with XRE-family HTH domain|nr:helix-turn-helix domain-containing protein [Acidovorax sp.]